MARAPRPKTTAFVLTCCISASLAAGCAKRYRVDGLVLSADAARKTLTVSHRDIPGYMPAMSMPFRAHKAAEVAALRPGMRVSFDLERGTARRIRVRRTETGGIQLPAPADKLAVGSAVPDFALTGEDGSTVRLSGFRGRVVVVDFIYTRCPLPEVCPRLSANFARLQRQFGDRATLLSITLDPQYDTPAVLADYAKRWGAHAGWHFLGGELREIERIARSFGLTAWPEEGVIVHTSQTAVIARDGTLAAVVEGSSYQYGQLADLVASLE